MTNTKPNYTSWIISALIVFAVLFVFYGAQTVNYLAGEDTYYGVVVDAETGEPIAGVQVDVMYEEYIGYPRLSWDIFDYEGWVGESVESGEKG